MNKGPLTQAVKAYLEKDMARLHMPGHKGVGEGPFRELLPWDITEVAGADSLFHADGPILELEKRLAALYGAKRTLLSAGGATLCIQTMLALACKPGDRLLMGRNLHRAAINACALLDLDPVWIDPARDAGDWFLGRYQAQGIQEALERDSSIRAVYLTTPDYFGVMSDLRAIGAVCRKKGIPLLVDNAHGAHLKFLPQRYGQTHPVDCGAAICCDSLHKTMPAMTGGALLHICEEAYIDQAKQTMSLFGSTSPSYPILLSCERALLYGESGEAEQGFDWAAKQLDALRRLALEKKLALPLGAGDPAKLSLGFGAAGISQEAFEAHLRANQVEPEYTSGTACVLMATGFNRQEDFQRIGRALETLPEGLQSQPEPFSLPHPQKALSIRQAVFAPQESLPVGEALLGRIAAKECSPCPPGVPLLMPGEQIDQETLELLELYGVQQVNVVKETQK